MKNNTGKKRFLRDAVKYITSNGPATAAELHDALRFTITGKLLRDSPSRHQVAQILHGSKLFDSQMTEVGYNDPARYTTYPVKQYSLAGEQ